MSNEEILPIVKRHLKITFSYMDDEILELIEETKTVINSICGLSEYKYGSLAMKLLKAHVRYAISALPSTFEYDYRHDLLKLQIENGVNRSGK
ncbi:hypothetical protein [Facklamia miroungae]|uniref:Phage gp6-like head-tail connector protein n=1 Tax=Facklamia miroungae TaxID=120956 RepID=A0A1G7P012_9LACT|nr:hypothetical protein [Facklamia miroungae]NKZ28532.1 phage gp6-like head-tail connector protein [Facklamia miroungae]SDF79583.1 hypothetical protein SAMN05421791_10173 [Facklamia miroungae]